MAFITKKQHFIQTAVGVFPAGEGSLRVNLTTHIHLASNLRMSGAETSLPPYAFRAHTVKLQPSHQSNKAAGNVNSLV